MMIVKALLLIIFIFSIVLWVTRRIQKKHQQFKTSMRQAEDPEQLMAMLEIKKLKNKK